MLLQRICGKTQQIGCARWQLTEDSTSRLWNNSCCREPHRSQRSCPLVELAINYLSEKLACLASQLPGQTSMMAGPQQLLDQKWFSDSTHGVQSWCATLWQSWTMGTDAKKIEMIMGIFKKIDENIILYEWSIHFNEQRRSGNSGNYSFLVSAQDGFSRHWCSFTEEELTSSMGPFHLNEHGISRNSGSLWSCCHHFAVAQASQSPLRWHSASLCAIEHATHRDTHPSRGTPSSNLLSF